MADQENTNKDKLLLESLVISEEVFAGKLLRVRRDTVRLPDGKQATREVDGAVPDQAASDSSTISQ